MGLTCSVQFKTRSPHLVSANLPDTQRSPEDRWPWHRLPSLLAALVQVDVATVPPPHPRPPLPGQSWSSSFEGSPQGQERSPKVTPQAPSLSGPVGSPPSGHHHPHPLPSTPSPSSCPSSTESLLLPQDLCTCCPPPPGIFFLPDVPRGLASHDLRDTMPNYPA